MVEAVELVLLTVVLKVVLAVLDVVLEVLEEVLTVVLVFTPGTHSPQIRGQNLNINDGISSHIPCAQ